MPIKVSDPLKEFIITDSRTLIGMLSACKMCQILHQLYHVMYKKGGIVSLELHIFLLLGTTTGRCHSCLLGAQKGA